MTPKTIDTIIAAVGMKPADRIKLAEDLDKLAEIIHANRTNRPPT